MSDIADSAKAVVFVADHAVADPPGNKINALGVAWQVTTLSPSGATPGQAVVAVIEVPQRFAGDEVALSLSLRDSADNVVALPQPPDGNPQPMRVAQVAVVDKPLLPGVATPKELKSRMQIVLGLPSGLTLRPGELYTWRLEIDGTTRDDWTASFFVVPAPSQVVVG